MSRILSPIVVALCALPLFAADEPITPEMAREFDGKEVTVKMIVKSGRNLLNERQKYCYLNSEPDYKNRENLGVVVHETAAEELKHGGSNQDPYQKLKGKTIKVTGKVEIVRDAVKLHVDKASQIEVLDEKIFVEQPIAPDKAREFDGKQVTVKMTVKSGKNLLNEKQKYAYLNSESDFWKEENLAVVIHEGAAEEFKEVWGNEDPVLKFKGKVINVTGRIQVLRYAVKLHVNEASQIELVEEKKPEDRN